ncbi:uncharacterized protein TNCV_2283391 [Trichonephila clavipes]|nr:uncharacterized protein TNCV_2283391 [Trichonephila clavipes]
MKIHRLGQGRICNFGCRRPETNQPRRPAGTIAEVLHQKGDFSSETITKIQQVFGDYVMGITQIKEGFNRFKIVRTLVESDQLSGRLQTTRDAVVVEKVENMIIFVEWSQNEIAVVPDFHKRILFSDEAHFWLNGYASKQNCRIWSEANPQMYVETPLHPEKLTVWCALWAGGIIGPYFFKNDEGHNVTVNGDRYRAMITNFFIPELNNHDVQELWFQQDGATCHTARATIDLLKENWTSRLDYIRTNRGSHMPEMIFKM